MPFPLGKVRQESRAGFIDGDGHYDPTVANTTLPSSTLANGLDLRPHLSHLVDGPYSCQSVAPT